MNNREKRILLRIQFVLGNIPLPVVGGGTKSASIRGCVSYADDMIRVTPDINDILFYLRIGELEEAERILGEIECWIKEKTQQEHIYPAVPVDKV